MSDSLTYVFSRPADVLRITGTDRVDLLHRLSTQDLRPLRAPGTVRQTLFTTQQGKLVDWTRVFALDGELRLFASAGRGAEVKAWIDKYTIMEDVVSAVMTDMCELVLVGPDAARLAGLEQVPQSGTFVTRNAGMWSAGLAAFGTSVSALVPAVAAALLQRAARDGGAALADAARVEVLRLQAGVPAAGFEFREQVNPLELRLTKHAVGWNKGCYIGQEVISRLDSYDKVARVLMGFESDAPLDALPEGQGYKVAADGKPVGRVTSWVNTKSGAIGLALVKREAAVPGQAQLEGGAAGDGAAVRLVTRPFFE